MQYLCLLYDIEDRTSTPAQQEAELGRYFAFDEAAAAAGVLRGGHALMPTSTATTVAIRDGQTLVTDGPFAETREALGGYYLLECADLDEALEWAARIPAAESGRVEIRPIMRIEGEGAP